MSSWDQERKKMWAIVFELKRQLKTLKEELEDMKNKKEQTENTKQTA